jgi:hypothetical protein
MIRRIGKCNFSEKIIMAKSNTTIIVYQLLPKNVPVFISKQRDSAAHRIILPAWEAARWNAIAPRMPAH